MSLDVTVDTIAEVVIAESEPLEVAESTPLAVRADVAGREVEI